VTVQTVHAQLLLTNEREVLGSLPRSGRPRIAESSPTKRKFGAIKRANDEALGGLSDKKLSKRLKNKTPEWSTSYTKQSSNGSPIASTRSAPCARTIANMRKRGTFSYVPLRTVPLIDEATKTMRLDFCAARRSEDIYNEVHLDESVVLFELKRSKFKGIMTEGNAMQAKKRVSVLPANGLTASGELVASGLTDMTEAEQLKFARNQDQAAAVMPIVESSNLHPPKLLLFGAITCPTPDDPDARPLAFTIDGHPIVALFQIVGQRERVNTKRNAEGVPVKGPGTADPFIYTPTTINQYAYREILLGEGGLADMYDQRRTGGPVEARIKRFYVPVDKSGNVDNQELIRRHEAREMAQKKKKRRNVGSSKVIIAIQEDGAPAHGFANTIKGDDKSTEVHKTLVEQLLARGFDLFKQARYSPDLNACDVGFWHMCKALIDDRLGEVPLPTSHLKTSTEQAMWEILREEAAKIPARKVFNIFHQQRANMEAVFKAGGASVPRQPHTGIRTKFGTHDKESSTESSAESSVAPSDEESE